MKKKQSGVSLIELVVFVAALSIGVAGITVMFTTLLSQSPITEQVSQALSLAEARMELILGQRHFVGYTGIVDPCTLGSPPAICSNTLSGYTVTSSFTPTTINTDANYSVVAVTVTGPASQKVILKSLIANY